MNLTKNTMNLFNLEAMTITVEVSFDQISGLGY